MDIITVTDGSVVVHRSSGIQMNALGDDELRRITRVTCAKMALVACLNGEEDTALVYLGSVDDDVEFLQNVAQAARLLEKLCRELAR